MRLMYSFFRNEFRWLFLCGCLLLGNAALFTVQAQTEQGTWLVGGNLGGSFQLGKWDSGGSGTFDKDNAWSAQAAPMVGYLLLNHLAVGTRIDFSLGQANRIEQSTAVSNNSFYAGIGPFARYYFSLDERWAAFGQAQPSFGFSQEKSEIDFPPLVTQSWSGTRIDLSAGPGMAFFLNKKVGIEAYLPYTYYLENLESDTGTALNRKGHRIRLQVGIQAYL